MSNLGTLRTAVRRLIDETDSANTSYQDTELNDYLNQAARKAATLLEWPIATFTATSISGTAEYGLPVSPQLLFLIQVFFDGKQIDVVDRSEMSGLYGDWINADNGEPRVAYRVDNNVLGLFPAPDPLYDNKTIEIHAIKLPAALSADADVPDLHQILQDCIPIRAAVFAELRAGNYKAAQYLEALFDKEIVAAKSKLNKWAEDLVSFRWS